jgi:SAM-dependent methyltransferase
VAHLNEELVLGEDASVLDVGCGQGTLLMEIVSRHGCQGVGVDIDAVAIQSARQEADARGLSPVTTFITSPAADYHADSAFDLCVCVGASHALGGYRETLESMRSMATPSALFLVGEGFWRRPPDPAYLDHIGAAANELVSHRDNIEVAASMGLGLAWCAITSDATWDNYEELYRLSMLQHLDRHPEDPDRDAFRQRSDHWYDGYRRWGRNTMGFALYLFRRDPDGGKESQSR